MKIKKMMAAMLAAVMTMSAAGSALAAAQSPIKPSVDGYIDVNAQDHDGNVVTSEINQDEATAFKAESTGEKGGKTVTFDVARNSKNENVPITTVGSGKKGLFNSKKGRNITKAIFASTKNTTVKKLAFKGSKIKVVTVKGQKVTFSKDSFKGTKQKKITLQVKTKKASSIKLKKGAFNGLTKVTVKGLSKKEYNKLLKAAKKAGIKTSLFKKG